MYKICSWIITKHCKEKFMGTKVNQGIYYIQGLKDLILLKIDTPS